MTPLISVIIPVYNVEKYIDRSISSVIEQSYKNIEIILVNDGSTDNSGNICDTFAEKDCRIKVIHKSNSGVSAARNSGIETATGDYLCFIDSDDYVSTDYVKHLFETAVKYNTDITTSNQYKIWHDGKQLELFTQKAPYGTVTLKSGIETLSDMLYGKTCYATCCCKLYKKEIFSDIRFPQYRMGEDSFTMYKCFLKAESVAHLYQPDYYYVQHESSAMHTVDFSKFYDYIELSDAFMRIVTKDYPELFLPAVNRLIENNFWVYMKMRTQPDKYQKELNHIIRNIKTFRKYALKDKNVCLRTRTACLLSFFGMNVLNKIYDNIAN
ncbi:MAG: glycosyltransferase family 2 protein [Clostridia bacterium]|nr:glycosyltransferase family 2 protein [Clostridia bacterium]